MKRRYGITVTELLIGFVCLDAFAAVLLAYWTESNLDFWISYWKGVPTHVGYWTCWLISLPAPLAFIADVIMSVARLFV